MSFNQSSRRLRVTQGPLSADDVLVTSLSGHEAISRLYSFQLDFVSRKLALEAPDLIGKPISLAIDRGDATKEPRFINGFISRFSAGDVATTKTLKYREYRAECVPSLWFLTQTARCHIFFPEKEDKSIFEIITEAFDHAKRDLDVNVTLDPVGIESLKQRKVKHCVQYRETDFNFLSRIFEQYGVYYYFTQSDGEHKLVLSTTSSYPSAMESEVSYPVSTGSSHLEDHITNWEHAYEFVSGKWTHSDYNFETPSTPLRKSSTAITNKVPSAAKFEVYDFPGEYSTPEQGDSDARIRQEEEEVPHDSVQASSGCRTLMPGHAFKLACPPGGQAASDNGGTFLITSIHHHASQPGPETGSSGQFSYSNSFACIPNTVQFRPARLTPKPVVSGIQTAVVVGTKGKEIETDEYGRIKVAFQWDRENEDRKNKNHDKVKNGENFYCWVRVAQNMAGNKWGFMAIPRIGQEVVVDFIDGDPDRPLVIGSVYNKEQMPHYNPEEHNTRTYIKTNSSPGGEGFNELRFEDKQNEEQIFIHAQRNMDVRVRNDSMELIYGNRHQIIGWEDKEGEKGGDQKEEIKKDKHIKVHNDHTEQVGGNMMLLVGGGDGDGNQDIVIKKDKKELIEANSHHHVKADELEAIDGNRCTEVGGDQYLNIGGSSAHIAGADHLMKGMNISIEGQAICLKSGGNSITIDPSGVTIVGTLVRVNSGPAPPVISQAAMIQPKPAEDAQEAEPKEPTKADNDNSGAKSAPG